MTQWHAEMISSNGAVNMENKIGPRTDPSNTKYFRVLGTDTAQRLWRDSIGSEQKAPPLIMRIVYHSLYTEEPFLCSDNIYMPTGTQCQDHIIDMVYNLKSNYPFNKL